MIFILVFLSYSLCNLCHRRLHQEKQICHLKSKNKPKIPNIKPCVLLSFASECAAPFDTLTSKGLPPPLPLLAFVCCGLFDFVVVDEVDVISDEDDDDEEAVVMLEARVLVLNVE